MEKLQYFFLGCLMLVSASFVVAGTEVFYLQHSVVLIFATTMLVTGRKFRVGRLSRLDGLIVTYFSWVLISYLVSGAISALTWSPQAELRRGASLFMVYSLGAAFLVGRLILRKVGFHLKHLVWGLICTYVLTAAYTLYQMFEIGLADLFMARDAIGQRLPFVLCFVAIIVLALAIFWKRQRLALLAIFTLGIAVVLLSLTRAAYLQLALSLLALAGYLAYKKPKSGLILLGTLVLLLTVGGGIVASHEQDASQTVLNRIEQIGRVEEQATVDVSGSYRLAVWRALTDKMSETPVRWLVGYGQLGASFIVQDVEYDHGVIAMASAHSQYMDVLVREGVVGLVLFCLCFGELVRIGLFRLSRFEPPHRPFIFAHSIALIGVAVYGLFHETVRYPMFGFYFWMYAGIVAKLMSEARTAPRSILDAGQSNSPNGQTNPQVVGTSPSVSCQPTRS